MALDALETNDTWRIPRPPNCDPKLYNAGSNDPRCPACGLWHLRPGYCMGHDPMYAKPVTPVTEDRNVTLERNAKSNAARQAAYRARKKG